MMTLVAGSTLFLVPASPAQEAEASPGFVGMYLKDNILVFDKPAGTTTQMRSLNAQGSAPNQPNSPALANPIEWGPVPSPETYTFESDGVMTFWITSNGNAVITQVDVQLIKASTSLGRGSSGNFVDSGTTANNVVTPQKMLKFTIGVPLTGQTISAGDAIKIRVNAWGLSDADTGATDLHLVYGSADKPAGLVLAVDDPGAATSVGGLSGLYLADNALSSTAPVAVADKSRQVANYGPASLATAAEWEWGRIQAPTGFTIQNNAPLTAWLGLGGGAASGYRGFRANLYVADAKATEAIGIRSGTLVTATPLTTGQPVKVIVGLPTQDLVVPAGSTLRITFQVWSLNHNETGPVHVFYGSAGRPSGLYLASDAALGSTVPDNATGTPTNMTTTGSPKTVSAARTSTSDGTGETTIGAEVGNGDDAQLANDTENVSGEADQGGRAKDITTPEAILPATAAWLVLAVVCGAVLLVRRR